MKEREQDIGDIIEKYLEGTLTAEESAEFEKRLTDDPELNTMVSDRRKIAETWGKAVQYKNTREEVRSIIQRAKKQKTEMIYRFAAAAVFLGLVIISAGIWLNKGITTKREIAQKESKDELIQPQFRKAEEKADFGVIDSLNLLSPVRHEQFKLADSVIFRWETGLPDSAYLVIQSLKNGKTVYKEKIGRDHKIFLLEKNFLPEGDYQWFIDGYPEREFFKIIR